jgi:hypothetical protein
MNQIRLRRVAHLEKRALPHIEQRKRIEQQWQHIRRGAVAHATVLALLVRYGNPQVGEPLSCAGGRVTKTEYWGLFHQKFPPDRTIYPAGFEYSFPYTRDQVTIIGDSLRHVSIATFPGADEKEKLNCLLRAAPPWLLWFTFADYSAKLLGLSLPDLSTVRRFERSNEIFHAWWGLPQAHMNAAHGPMELTVKHSRVPILACWNWEQSKRCQLRDVKERERSQKLRDLVSGRLIGHTLFQKRTFD